MKIILLDDVRGFGKKYDVKEATGGYARNFLFPRKLAEPATEDSLKKLEARKANLDKEEKESVKRLEETARKIGERRLELYLKTDEKGKTFGSVNKETILSGLRDAGLLTKEHAEIKLERPIKELGDYETEVDLKKEVKAKLRISVRPQK